MKRFAIMLLILLVAAGAAYGERKPAGAFTFIAAQKQAYWYSLYNVAHLTMFAGMGEIMKGGGMTGIIEWLKGGGVQKAELVKDMYMISSTYQQGDPHFTQRVDLDKKRKGSIFSIRSREESCSQNERGLMILPRVGRA